MFNYQAIAVRIETKLRNKGLAKMGDADSIRVDPIGFLDSVLGAYESQSEENELRAADFWDVYESYKGKTLDSFGEETARHFAEDVAALFLNQ